MIQWLESHVWLCSYVVAGCALLTLLIRLFNRKRHSGLSQTVKKVNHSTINQVGGNITISGDSHE
jgi:hypothetical protein